MIPETRECPACHAEHDISELLRTDMRTIECACGAQLELCLEDLRTDDGIEQLCYFEVRLRP